MNGAAQQRVDVAEALLNRVVGNLPDADLVRERWDLGELRVEFVPAGDGFFHVRLVRPDGHALVRLRGRRSAFLPGGDS